MAASITKQSHKHRFWIVRPGFTLVECMIMMFILMIMFSGMLGFRYYSILNAERAEDQILAARAAVTLSEAWRGQRGAVDFDPVNQGFDDYFQIQAASVDEKKDPFMGMSTYIGSYQVDIEGRSFRAHLAYQNVAGVPNARMLYVTFMWRDNKRSFQQFQLSTLSRTAS